MQINFGKDYVDHSDSSNSLTNIEELACAEYKHLSLLSSLSDNLDASVVKWSVMYIKEISFKF